jgi:four helix bundle protein
MLNQFRTYQISLEFYKSCSDLKLPRHLKDQLVRASSSIALNLAEGSAKPTKKDQMKFYFIAFGSLRECQAILSLSGKTSSTLLDQADHLGASLYTKAEFSKLFSDSSASVFELRLSKCCRQLQPRLKHHPMPKF